ERHLEGMNEKRFARCAGLSGVVDQGKIVSLADDLQIILRTVFGDLGQQLLKLDIQQLRSNRLQVCRHVRLYLEPGCRREQKARPRREPAVPGTRGFRVLE